MRRSKRAILKSKTYGFNPWADQVPAINQIMEETGQRSEAPVVRDLVDEALAARRRNGGPPQTPEPSADGEALTEALNTLQTLVLRLISEKEMIGRMQGVTLELLQETLAETRAGRMISWSNLVVPLLRDKALNTEQIERNFDMHTQESRRFAYGLTEQIKSAQEVLGGETEGEPNQALLF